MSKPDGVIRFRTEADNSELEKQLEDAKKKVESVEGKIKELNKDRTSALNAQRKAQEKLTKAQEEYNAAVKKQKAAQEKVDAARDTLAAAEGRRKELVYDINASRNADEKTRLSNELNQQMDAVIQARAELEAAENAATYDDAVASASQNVDAATASLREAQTAVNNIDASISSANSELEEAENNAGNLGNQFRAAEEKSRRLQKPIDAASKSVEKFMKRLKRMALNAAVFSVIAKGLSALKDRLSDAIEQSEEASAAMNQLSGAAKTAAQPIINLLVPALTSLAQALTRTIVLTGSLFGKDFVKDASEAAQALDKVKKAKQGLAGFDEINVIGNNNDDGSSSSYEFNDVISGQTANAAKTLNRIIAEATLAVGAILTFSGTHMLLGIALMALGATALVSEVKDDWTSTENKVVGAVTGIETVLAAAMFVIGAILLFSGQVGLGIAAILLGIELSAVAYSFDALKEELQTPLGELAGLMVGVTLVIIGIILCCAQAWPLGIGAIVAGAAALVGTIAVNWNAIKEGLQDPLGAAVAVIGGVVLIVLGVLLCCAQAWPLGIGLIVAGVAFIGTTVAVNWNSIEEHITPVLAGALAIISGMGLVLGILLCLTPGTIGLGLALIFASLAGTKKALSLSDNPVTRFVKGIANGVIGVINSIAEAINDLFHIKFDGLKIGGVQIIPSFDTQLLRLPTIPKLAQGAVLPANQPFLAMVGDQKHGTNVEAPLTTIQEAVALVMEDNTNGMMAGFEALVAEVQQLRAAVEGIEVGDSTIGQAANRYNQRMAIIRG